MSAYVNVEVSYGSGSRIDVDEIAEVRVLANKAGYSFNDLRDLFEDGQAEFGGYADGLTQLVADIARLYPGVDFMMRCCGEELVDTALRGFKGGQVVFMAGPWRELKS